MPLSLENATFTPQNRTRTGRLLSKCTSHLEKRRNSCFTRYVHSLARLYRYRYQQTNHTKAGFLAQKRLARGLRLNQTETVALIASQLQERIRDGVFSVAELMHRGKTLLGRRHVLPSVPALLHEIQVEGTFIDGYVSNPISREVFAETDSVM